MFEIGWSELLVIAVVAIVVIGPKELPGVLRGFGRTLAKLRRSADDFRRQFEESIRESGFEDVQKDLHSMRAMNPANQIRDGIQDAFRGIDAPSGAVQASQTPHVDLPPVEGETPKSLEATRPPETQPETPVETAPELAEQYMAPAEYPEEPAKSAPPQAANDSAPVAEAPAPRASSHS